MEVRNSAKGIGLLSVVMALTTAFAQETPSREGEAFDYEDRSTLETIPFHSLEEESLANTVIDGGLAAPASGVPVRAADASNEDFYLDPLALQPRDSRVDLGRSEIPVDFRFSNQRSIPGQQFGNDYVIRPPQNRTYDALNSNLQGR
ncbi:hypothetical protein [Marinobacter caseinilyticus]|uniref:hypothetical protein n=1 Tax=Marinobacter caseinilyticus TaxID=2692195 RepID=UPI001F37E9EC|nr:hypothetical protein [Marinobacter caseinilyticus]